MISVIKQKIKNTNLVKMKIWFQNYRVFLKTRLLKLCVWIYATNINGLKISFDKFEVLKYNLDNYVNYNNLLKKLLK